MVGEIFYFETWALLETINVLPGIADSDNVLFFNNIV